MSAPVFTARMQKVLQLAREEADRLNHNYIGSEHFLLGLIQEGEGVAVAALIHLGLDLDAIRQAIEDAVETSGGTALAQQQLPLTPRARQILEISVQLSRQMKVDYTGTEHLLLALIKDKEGVAARILTTYGVTFDAVQDVVMALLSGKSVDNKEQPKSKTPFLDHFSRDLTQLAREGKIDPTIGREREIERVSQVLSRRKKNNPVLIGEPGVGKTAIVEGLAQRIVDKKVPQILNGKRLVALDLGGVVSGTKYRGQFEERIKGIINELQQNKDVFLFIDEMHTIVGAGSAEGTLDASNMFKPALARGELQCIGATTLDEYRRHIEKDGALERRFQTIMVDPPSVADSIEILKGLRKRYEEHHHAKYMDEAVVAAATLSDRYISNRYLPDKAIDVIDEAGSRVHLSKVVVPVDIRNLEQAIEDIEKKKGTVIEEQHFEEAIALRDEGRRLKEKLGQRNREWEEEVSNYQVEVTEEDIAEVISSMTGIPVFRLAREESEKLLQMEEALKKRIVGQDEAITAISKAIRRSRSGLKDPKRPIGSFVFLGPTGVGKTELARVLAEYLFEDRDALIQIDMSEYSERFSLSRLIGAPPGYVGYDEGGQLTEKVRRKPYSVVLFDEIEKAHPDFFNLLLQVLDDGRLTDSFGRHVDFRNTVIIMTSNLGTRDIGEGRSLGFQKTGEKWNHERMKEKILAEMKRTFNPEFLNRVDESMVFHSLGRKEILRIIDMLLEEVNKRAAGRDLTLNLTPGARSLIADKGYDPAYGARPLRRAIQKLVEDPLTEELLGGKFRKGDSVRVSKKGDDLTFALLGEKDNE
ncbi:MAG: ATP-dependent Clp protease ATP-binding subunit [Candidatus Latescibacterota bacterium]